MKKFLRALSIISILAIFCCIITSCNYAKTETTIVKATVTSKKHIDSHNDYGYYFDGWKGKYRWKYKRLLEEYNVTVQYNDLVEIYDSKSLYEAVEIGDTIDVELITYFDFEGEIQSQSIFRIN